MRSARLAATLFVALGLLGLIATAQAQTAVKPEQREEKAGWIIVHLNGTPKEIGFQHGSLLSAEIVDALKVVGESVKRGTGKEWNWFRLTAHRLFWNKLTPELQEEIKAISDGAKSKGAAVEADDILALNGHIEIEGYYLPLANGKLTAGRVVSRAPMACSAFVATGSYTKDNKVVMGHNFWWDYASGQRFRVIMDVKPTKGHQFMMDTMPGLIHSATDFAINDAGMMMTETTISGFVGFDETGIPEFARIRNAMQFADSIDEFCRIMETGNNGGYANTWLIADSKTSENGKLELGLKSVHLERTKDGAYGGANFPESKSILANECKGYNALADPSCPIRRKRWTQLFAEHKGSIDSDLARKFLADTTHPTTGKVGARVSTLCGRADLDPLAGNSPSGAINAKVVTSAMVKEMRFDAKFGFPDNSTLNAKTYLETYPQFSVLKPYLRDFVANPWLTVAARK
ncbi:MAG: C45 family peptidase [Chthonomonadales bacterium]